MLPGAAVIWRLAEGWEICHQDGSLTWLSAVVLRSLLAVSEQPYPPLLDLSIGLLECPASPRVSGPRGSKEETAMPFMTYPQKSQSTISTTFYPLETSRAHAQRRGMKPLLIGRIIRECVDTFLNHHKGSFLLSFGASDLQVRILRDLSFILSKY